MCSWADFYGRRACMFFLFVCRCFRLLEARQHCSNRLLAGLPVCPWARRPDNCARSRSRLCYCRDAELDKHFVSLFTMHLRSSTAAFILHARSTRR